MLETLVSLMYTCGLLHGALVNITGLALCCVQQHYFGFVSIQVYRCQRLCTMKQFCVLALNIFIDSGRWKSVYFYFQNIILFATGPFFSLIVSSFLTVLFTINCQGTLLFLSSKNFYFFSFLWCLRQKSFLPYNAVRYSE